MSSLDSPTDRLIRVSRISGGNFRDSPTVNVARMQYLLHADVVKRWGSDIKGSVFDVMRSR